MWVAAPLAYVRLDDGDVAELVKGDKVPDNAAADHVEHLREKGALVDEEPDVGGKGGDTPDPDPQPAKKATARPGPPRGGSPS